MSETETIFSTSMKSTGIFNLKEFYKFCYDWLTEETELFITEKKYEEKLVSDNKKELKIEWEGVRKVTDYFKFEVKIKYEIKALEDIEVAQGSTKIKTNRGSVKMILKGNLIRDYQGKFEQNAFNKFLRSIYEKWVIAARIEQYEDKLIGDCDEFLAQAKAFLVLEGKR